MTSLQICEALGKIARCAIYNLRGDTLAGLEWSASSPVPRPTKKAILAEIKRQEEEVTLTQTGV